METWFVLSITVAFFWGTSGIFAKASTGKLGVARVALLITLVEGPMYVIAFLVWREPAEIDIWTGLLAAGSCIVGISGYLCYFESLIDGQVAIAGTISAAYPALTVIGAVMLLGESLAGVHSIGVAVIIAGVLGLSYERGTDAASKTSTRSLTFAFMAFLAWGVWSLTSKAAVDLVGAGNMFGFYIISSLTAPVLYAWFRRVRPLRGTFPNPGRLAWAFGAAALVVNVFGAFAYTYALEQGSASLVVPISSAYPLITVVMAMALLKERISRLQVVALAGVVVGLVLVGVTV